MVNRIQLLPIVRGIAWSAGVVVIAIGGGGLVVGADHPAGDATRPELTYRADSQMRTAIKPVATELHALEADVAALGRTGRTALEDLSSQNVVTLQRTLDQGDILVTSIQARKDVIRGHMNALPYASTSDRIGDDVRASVRAVGVALSFVDKIAADWGQLARGAVPATRLRQLLEEHDKQTFAATESARRDQYARAVDQLKRSLDLVAQAQRIRDGLAATADVTVLTQWLDRNRRLDLALTTLYSELEPSGGARVTPRARAAFAEVRRLQDLLPTDTRALIVVMADIAQGGLTQAVVAIEEARGRLADASAAVD